MKKFCVMQVAAIFIIALLLVPEFLTAKSGDVQYTVKKGDTLWTISSGYLKDPLLWPKLWKANTNVHNPHLIYPDQLIVIPGELIKDGAKAGKKLTPVKARYIPAGSKSPLVSREVLLASGFITRSFVPVGKIASRFPEEETIFGKDSLVHIQAADRLLPDMKFYIGEMAEPIHNPISGEVVGYLVSIKGSLRITGEENGNIIAKILESYKEINSGDVIMKYFEFTPPYEPVVERTPLVSGVILKVGDKVSVDQPRMPGGKSDIVYIDKGAAQGIQIGDKFKISKGTSPNAIIGNIQVFSVFDDISAAIVTKAVRDISPGDTFGN